MTDYSLVPVDYQPDFGYSLVPVDYDPFAGEAASPAQTQPGQSAQAQVQPSSQVQQAQGQQAQFQQPTMGAQSQPAQTQPSQPQPQSSPQPAPSIQPTPTGGSSSPFVHFFNQLADPERAQAERVADLVQNHPTAAKIAGAIGLGSVLAPPLAVAGAEGLSLLGTSMGGSAVTDGLAGSTISGAGRAAAGSAARQAIADAEATLPEGMTRKDFQRLAGFANSLPASSHASTEATAEIISRLKAAGISSRSVAAFQKFYENAAIDTPSNLSAIHRAALLANILRNFE